MFAVDFYPDGLLAFLAAAVAAHLLASGLLVFSVRCFVEARRKGERFVRQPMCPQLAGMSVSLFCLTAVMLVSWHGVVRPRQPALNVWLDDSVLMWLACALSMWPVSAYVTRRLSRRHAFAPRGGTHGSHVGGEWPPALPTERANEPRPLGEASPPPTHARAPLTGER